MKTERNETESNSPEEKAREILKEAWRYSKYEVRFLETIEGLEARQEGLSEGQRGLLDELWKRKLAQTDRAIRRRVG